MRVIVVGLGVQGYKRRQCAGADFVADIDPVNKEARFRRVQDVPLETFDAALACVPDKEKIGIIDYLLSNGKHVLVEKPLFCDDDKELSRLGKMALERRLVCYTAYNHRFEPHFVRMRDLIASGALGRLYHCRMFYGNGTARLVRNSAWRDQGAGVLPDLGSHLLDTARYWFGELSSDFDVVSASRFENRSPDHVVIASRGGRPQLELEMTLLSWRNHFTCDIFAEKGSAHIASLCKWGPTTFTQRTRALPSGRPLEQSITLIEEDPTWKAEYHHFKGLCETRSGADLSNDLWLNDVLGKLGKLALQRIGP